MVLFRKAMILSHRYLGIALSLLFVVWFASGITMMYAGGMPRLIPDERLERLTAVDLRAVRLTPAEAARKADVEPGATSLLTIMDRPAYRVGGGFTVFADNGDLLEEVDAKQAAGIVSRFMNVPASQITHLGTITEPDQWTIGQSRQMPLHKFQVDDPARTQVYVSAWLAEVTMITSRRSRTLAWLGTIPHWFYFAALRANQPLWYQIVVWTSGLGVVLALLGLILGVTQYRWSRPRAATGIPYSGWMRWHYITGVIFGVFTLTWVFSGMLSMEPYGWATQPGLQIPRDAFTGGTVDLSRFAAMDPAKWDQVMAGRDAIKEVEFLRIHDEPYYGVKTARALAEPWRRERLHQPYNVSGRLQGNRIFVHAETLAVRDEPFSADAILARMKAGGAGRAGCRRAAVAGVRLLLLLASRADSAADSPREVCRPRPDLGLRRSRSEPGGRAHPQAGSRRALDLQRPAQPRLFVLVQPPTVVGHRCADADARRPGVERDRTVAGNPPAAAGSEGRDAVAGARVDTRVQPIHLTGLVRERYRSLAPLWVPTPRRRQS